MSRGSVHTWEDYGRRTSVNMSPFSGNRAEFMTIDTIEYKRNDGWFLSYPKLAAAIVVFIIGVLAAGFLGWYVHTSPRKKGYDALDVINEDITEDAIVEASILPYVHPVEYHLDLAPIIEADGVSKIKGRVVIEFRIDETMGLTKLTLNARNITVVGHKLLALSTEQVAVRSRRRRRNVEENMLEEHHKMHGSLATETATRVELSKRNVDNVGIVEYKVDENEELHTVYLARPIKEGTYILEIDYESLVTDEIFYHANYTDAGDKWLMGAKLKPFNVRSLFPLFEDTQLKTPFSVSIARPGEMRVLSNMPVRVSKDRNDEEVVDIFSESPPLSIHNFAFVIGNIESSAETLIMDAKVRGTFWDAVGSHSQGTYLIDRLDPAVINLIDMFSMPYPFEKLDLVGLPAGINQNIARPGLISIKRSEWSTMKESSAIMRSGALRSLINLLGRQWLECVVNMNRTDVWVHESTLLFFQYTLADKIDPSLESSNSFLVDVLHDVMETDGYSVFRSIHTSINHMHSDPFYDEYMKGACLLRMLHHAIGDSSFRNGLKGFIENWKYKTTNAIEFFKAMSENATEVLPDISLEEIMDSWISQSGYPILFVMRDYEAGTIKIHQAQFTYDTLLDESDKLWHVPLTYVNDSSGFSSPTVAWLSEREMIMENFGHNDSWILFNINKTGYYRVHYDENNWRYLSAALQEDHESFPMETRASLIDDVFSLAAVGLTTYRTAFDFIKYMQMKERHYAPWGVLMKHAFKLNRLLYETSIFTEYQEFMLDFISPLYNEFGLNNNDGAQLALISVRMACEFEHGECLDKAKEAFMNMQADPLAKESIPDDLRKTFYCTIARYGTRKEYNYFMENATFITDRDERERFLSSLSCFQAPWVLQTILIEIVHGNVFHEDEIPVILHSFPKNPAAAQVASRFVRSNWQDILKRFPDSHIILRSFILSMLNGLTTEQDIEDLQEFRDEKFDELKGGKYATAVVEANLNFVTTWLESSLPEIEQLLSKNATSTASEMR